MSVLLEWVPRVSALQKVYRSTSTIDPGSLPAPIASLAAGETTYLDETVEDETTYYYRVSSTVGGVEVVSAEVSITTTVAGAGGGGGGGGGDPHPRAADINIIEILNFSGADGSTTITQDSVNGGAFAAYGDAQIDTGVAAPAGFPSSVLLDGVGDVVSRSGLVNIGSSEFSIGLFVRFDALGSNRALVASWKTFANQRNFYFSYQATGPVLRWIRSTDGSDNGFVTLDASGISTDTWYWLTVARDANDDIWIGIDGTVTNCGPLAGGRPNNDSYLDVGGRCSGSTVGASPVDVLDGNIAGFVYVVGECIYDVNHSVPTGPHAPVT